MRRLYCKALREEARTSPQRFLAALALLVLTFCLPGATWARDPVTLAVEDDWPPFAFARGAPPGVEGLAVDIVIEALATQQVDVRLVVVPFARCMHLALVGQVLGCFNATTVDDNRDKFHWHKTPLFHETLAIYGRVAPPRPDLGLADLQGRRVGYTLGYTYPSGFFDDPKVTRVGAKSDEILLRMLVAGRVDYILMNVAPAQRRIAAAPAQFAAVRQVGTVSVDGFWVAFTKVGKGGAVLADQLQAGLEVLERSGRKEALEQAWRKVSGK